MRLPSSPRAFRLQSQAARRRLPVRVPVSSPWLAHVAAVGADWPAGPPTTKRPDVADVGRLGETHREAYLLAANFPRSVFVKRASFPLVAISLMMEL